MALAVFEGRVYMLSHDNGRGGELNRKKNCLTVARDKQWALLPYTFKCGS